MHTPQFWWQKNSFWQVLLKPLAWLYGLIAAHNMQRKNVAKIDLPVLCIGNFTLGGAGKTPVAISFAKAGYAMGLKIGVVTRGHGGKVKDVHIVNLDKDSAVDVGDEPLLLAKHCLVAVCPDRYSAAQELKLQGCDIILMDDGFQSRKLLPDMSLLVVDSLRGIGNGNVFPAGPLRCALKTQLAFSDKILIIGHEAAKFDTSIFFPLDKSNIFTAKLQPISSQSLAGKELLAFVGIGNPEKFFASIKQLGGIIKSQHIFADHHFFSLKQLQNIAQEAARKNLTCVTTAKDYARLKHQNITDVLHNLIIVDVEVDYSVNHFCEIILAQTIAQFNKQQNNNVH